MKNVEKILQLRAKLKNFVIDDIESLFELVQNGAVNNQKVKDEFLLLESRYVSFQKSKRSGLLNYEMESLIDTKIRQSAIEIINSIKSTDFDSSYFGDINYEELLKAKDDKIEELSNILALHYEDSLILLASSVYVEQYSHFFEAVNELEWLQKLLFYISPIYNFQIELTEVNRILGEADEKYNTKHIDSLKLRFDAKLESSRGEKILEKMDNIEEFTMSLMFRKLSAFRIEYLKGRRNQLDNFGVVLKNYMSDTTLRKNIKEFIDGYLRKIKFEFEAIDKFQQLVSDNV